MNERQSRFPIIAAVLLCTGAALCTATAFAGTRNVELRKPADPEGQVSVDAIAGSIAVAGWDRPEIEVTGTIGDRVERVDLTTSSDHATVRVVLPASSVWGGDTSANLVVHVPRKS